MSAGLELPEAARALLELPPKALLSRLCAGHPIDPRALDDTEYRGIALGMPAWFERLTWKKFQKVFHRDPQTHELRGWNVRLVQDGLDRESTPRLEGGVPKTFGHYVVIPAQGQPMPAKADAGLLIHYGLGGNGRLDPLHRVRDPLVALEGGDPNLLLGWSYVDLGLRQLGTPSFFLLQRERPLSHLAFPRGVRPTRRLDPSA